MRMKIVYNFKEAVRRRPFRSIILACLLFLFLSIARYLVWPPVGWLVTENPETTSFIEYRKDQWKAQQADRENNSTKDMPVQQKWVPLARISPALQKAVVLSEDDLFWEHRGFNLDMLHKAFMRTVERGSYGAGASTITQQVAKNLWFTPERTLLRKIKEAVMTWRLERTLEKKRILELYLNVAEWGNGIYGAEAAAQHYFKKSAQKLTAREAAILAVMLPAPLKRTPKSAIVKRLSGRLAKRMTRS